MTTNIDQYKKIKKSLTFLKPNIKNKNNYKANWTPHFSNSIYKSSPGSHLKANGTSFKENMSKQQQKEPQILTSMKISIFR